jgi:hypothetical protein
MDEIIILYSDKTTGPFRFDDASQYFTEDESQLIVEKHASKQDS